MRTAKTAMRVFLNDVKSFLKVFVQPGACYFYILVAVFAASFWFATFLNTVIGLSPATSGIAGAIIICGVAGLVYWVYTIIKRAKQQVKQENKNIINTLSGEDHEYDERLWLD